MRSGRMVLSRWALAVGLVALVPALVFAQGATTGNIVGSVTSRDDNARLPGATVVAVHEPTAARYTAVTREDGTFRMLNVRVGGPYTISVTMPGFEAAQKGGFSVRLGEDLTLAFQMSLEAFTEELVVYAEPSSVFNPFRTGATDNVSQESLESLPSISRSFEDFARTSVYFNPVAQNDGYTSLSVAGRNNRYNNVQIDGAVNNDLFGLAAQGTPGGQAETLPISLDAIQELQLLVSPYDIRQGGFSGGGVNAITKSGSNAFHGTAYYYTRDESLVGDREVNGQDVEFADFSNDQYGLTLGGPIMKDKVFFFVTGEFNRKDSPAGYSIGGTGQDWGHPDEAQRFRDILVNQYGYDPGGFDETIRTTDSDLFFGRLDFNLSGSHQLTLRHNYVDAENLQAYPSVRTYYMPDNFYEFTDETNSTVAQLNSVFGSDMFNEARVTYQTISDRRGGPTDYPQVSVTLSGGATIRAGREQYSTANSLDQDILEIHDDLTFTTGDHTFTVGTHNELFSFKNVFIRDNFGVYAFDSLDDFEAGNAYSYSYSFSNTDDPNQASEFDVQQYGLYAGDQWAVQPNLTLTYGLRVDAPYFPDEPSYNPRVYELYGVDTREVASGNLLWSPRVGFNWDVTGEGKRQLRGGTGVFSGRTPYVWMSNSYGNTGIEFSRISAFRPGAPIPFNPDPYNQPTSIPGVNLSTNEINAMDPDFEFPQVWRTSLAYDHDLGWWGLIGSVEGIYSKTLKDIMYQDRNLVRTGTLPDGRPNYTGGRVSNEYSYLIWLTNTDEGEQYSLALNLQKPFANGFTANAGYIYGKSESINDGNSSQATSNWRYLPALDANDPDLAPSNFDVEHRFVATVSYAFNITDSIGSTVALYYNHQAGRPYSTTYSRDMNGDNQDNDLIYVPAGADDVIIFGDGTWDQLDSYIQADAGLRDARGSIVERNASVAPWTHTLDFHFGVEIPISAVRTELTFDILNLSNLINSDWGEIKYGAFNEISPIRHRGYDADTGKPIYELLFTDPDRRWTYDDLRSRWQAKLGLRLSF